ncbi:MAG: sel1 repeat family protein, partial [Alphaproteobacteria bacterium]|nr:sel1 repeat family protein [Alphaproteobacteria bacterium]
MYLSRPALIVLMSLLATPAYAQDVGAGIEAYGRGDYDRALREWRPLAERGDSEAQAGLGLMHARGQGVRQ